MGRQVSDTKVLAALKGFRKEFLATRKRGGIRELMNCSYGKTVITDGRGKQKLYELYANGESNGFRLTVSHKHSTEEVLNAFLDSLHSLGWKVDPDLIEKMRGM